ncbi:NAD-dependent epimerase/dehydratase family protein [Chloroflexota bacterium]
MTGPILVTGGTGSVGRLVVNWLRKENHTVRVFDLPSMNYDGLEDVTGIEVLRGDITKPESVTAAVEGVSGVIHLAALLPPVSERNRDLTFAVNVEGTARLADELKKVKPDAPLVFSSSVSTYGDTTGLDQPVTVEQPQHALDIYAESKISAEKSLWESYPNAVVLRISGISVPAIQMPPEVWPYMADQRIEFVHRDDVVKALCRAVVIEEAKGKAFNIAGGETWRTSGKAYTKDYYDILGVPVSEAKFQDVPGWCDWYDTGESQRVLDYQDTSYSAYLGQLRAESEKMMQG